MRLLTSAVKFIAILPLVIGLTSLVVVGCRGKNLKSDTASGPVLKRIECKVPSNGVVKIHLENLNGGHAIGMKSTPEIKDRDIERMAVSTGSMTPIEIGRKGSFCDAVGAKYITMVYATGNTELSFHFRKDFISREIQIFVMNSVSQTKP